MAIQFIQQLAVDEATGALYNAVTEQPFLAGITTAQIAAVQALVSRAGNADVRASLPVWKAAVKRVFRGTGRGRLLILGDSTAAGAGSSNSTSLWTNSWANSVSSRLATALTAKGIPCSNNSLTTWQNISTGTYPAFDPRVALTGSPLPQALAAGASGNGLGGAGLWQVAVGTGKIAFTPVSQVDTFLLFTPRLASLTGTMTWDVNGGAPTGSLLQTGANALITTMLSPSLAANTLNLTNPASAATAFMSAVISYNSTVPAIDIINAGCSSLLADALDRNDSPYASATAIGFIAPDLTIIFGIPINDANAVTNPATFAAQMQTVITACKASGDVVIFAGVESSTAAYPSSNRADLLAQFQALAVTNSCVYMTPDTYIGGWTANDAAGLMYDNLHPTGNGYQRLAGMLAEALNGG